MFRTRCLGAPSNHGYRLDGVAAGLLAALGQADCPILLENTAAPAAPSGGPSMSWPG